MDRKHVRARIETVGIVPAIRAESNDDARFAIDRIVAAGISVLEITLTVHGAIELIRDVVRAHPDVVVGAGTVCTLEQAGACLDAGAAFLTSPGLDVRIVSFAEKQRVAVMPGVLTPTDVMAARDSGADLMKLFPCAPFGGPEYLRALKEPFPDVPFVAAGGVDQRSADGYLRAGAAALGIGAALIPPRAVRYRQTEWLDELARRFLAIVRSARGD